MSANKSRWAAGHNELAAMHLDVCQALAQDFRRTTRYVNVCERNASTFSIEYLRLLLDTGSEIEALAKFFCDWRAPGQLGDEPNIDGWRKTVMHIQPDFYKTAIDVLQVHRFQPWLTWGDTPPTNPDWWRAYNNVKHDRTKFFDRANLWNVISALCGMMAFASSLFPMFYHGVEQPWFKLVDPGFLAALEKSRAVRTAADTAACQTQPT